ncbi:Zinc finger CCCH domain-containing protein 3 [Heracleum sosnowskyi]|uniref:Zinc finger CCCH domain-containing protein 3 n=1 Tax=Heracleum sosnowskyi TaxID=360622 RepID=A0AAD8GR67_9APIA|nr:Zinc finger CCCH domain-containing protein 3 [Heracleum sosnowskyi]
MTETRQLNRNVHEGLRRLKIENKDGDGDGDGVVSYPVRPGEPDCSFYMRTGSCGYGANCRFNHPVKLDAEHPVKLSAQIGQFGGKLPQRVGEPECEYFLKTGACKYGSSCKYHHPLDRNGAGPVVLNSFGLPMRQEEKSCSFYMRTGTCKFGIACKFNHPELSSAGNPYTVLGTAVGGSAGMIIIPSSGLSYAGGIPSWPLLNEPYYISPLSQGVGWSTYMGSLNGQITPALTTVNVLPERHDQPECRHFMNTGSCKYGSDCKYNHPREKISQVGASSLGPFGLPLRPGQAICSYYTTYGICKYGPTCKFDHPLLGYSYSYGTNFPTVSISDPSSFRYQESSPMFHSYETSPSKSMQFPDEVGEVDATSKKDTSVKAAEESPEPAGSLSPSLSPQAGL